MSSNKRKRLTRKARAKRSKYLTRLENNGVTRGAFGKRKKPYKRQRGLGVSVNPTKGK